MLSDSINLKSAKLKRDKMRQENLQLYMTAIQSISLMMRMRLKFRYLYASKVFHFEVL